MTRQELFHLIREKKSFLCIGLDSDIRKIPPHLMSAEDPVFEFNRQIIDATHDLAAAYKPNLAFYESRGTAGWISLEKTIAYLKTFHSQLFTIADAKRGDIGNTSEQYAAAFLDVLDFDAVTVAPYMGSDSVTPFLKFRDKWVILLALTSNEGYRDFQSLPQAGGEPLFETVMRRSAEWGNTDQLMFVVGATRAEMLARVREIVPGHFLLIPGVGAQGGSLEDAARFGLNKECGILVNSSRGIIFASDGRDFATKARSEAQLMQSRMQALLQEHGLI